MTVDDASLRAHEAAIDTSLLKAHKRLSRRLHDSSPGSVTTSPPSLPDSPDMSSARSSLRARGPQPARLPEVFEAPLLTKDPLTPPLHQETRSGGSGSSRAATDTTELRAITPVILHSPPTPDTTPSRSDMLKDLSRSLAPKASMSSRTDSFRTAKSQVTASHEDLAMPVPSNPSRASEDYSNEMESTPRVGLGLGYDNSQYHKKGDQTFANFDSFWGSDGFDDPVKEAHNGDSEDSEIFTRKRRRGDYRLDPPPVDSGISIPRPYDSPTRSSTDREASLQTSDQTIRSAYTGREEELSARNMSQIIWRSEGRHLGEVERDDGRSSVVSVVPVYVVDPEPMKPRILRHSKAQVALRQPVEKGVMSDDEASRKSSRKSNTQSRKSGSSYQTVDTAKRDSVQSAVRLSTSTTASTDPVHDSPLTSESLRSMLPDNGDFFNAPRKRRSLSDAGQSEKRHSQSSEYPAIPQRRSSLSAPTSRNASRSQSLSSTSRKVAKLEPSTPKTFNLPARDQTPASSKRFTITTFGNSPSPEVVEAQAMGIYPHHNDSIVMVDKSNKKANAVANPPATPVKDSSLAQVESPLRNPRAAPEPPRPAPPRRTSTGLSLTSLSTRRPGGQVSGAVYALKRTFSSRSNTITLSSPEVQQPRTSMSTDHGTQTDISAKEQKDGFTRPVLLKRTTKLHPFWQPRSYWTGVEGREDREAEFPAPKQKPASLDRSFTAPAPTRTFSFSQKLGLRGKSIYPQRSMESFHSYRPFTALFFKNRRSPSPSPSLLSLTPTPTPANDELPAGQTQPEPKTKDAEALTTRAAPTLLPPPQGLATPAVTATPRKTPAPPTTPFEPPKLMLRAPTEIDPAGVRRNPTTTTIEAVNPLPPGGRKRSLSLMGRELEIEFVGFSGVRSAVRDRRAEKRRESLKKQIGEVKVIEGGRVF